MSFLVIRDPRWLLVSMVGVGFAWASILSLPYALRSDSLPAAKMGIYMPSAADRIRNLDRNGDGEINDEEMRNAAEVRFQWLDKNQDGKLDLSELKSGFGVPLSRP